MNYTGIINCTVADGLGFRTSLYVSGCKHCCEGCHNPETWDFHAGKPFTEEIEKILFDRIESPHIKGLTLSGGDPIYSVEEIVPLLKRFREKFGKTKDIWVYTGFTMDELKGLKNPLIFDLLDLVDVVVDGPFILSKRDITLPFRGSENQKIWKKDDNGIFQKEK